MIDPCPETLSADSSARRIWVSAVALIDTDGRLLMTQRPAGKSFAGLWEFPGGKIETCESPEAALIRELEEELGISTHASCLAPLTFASHAYPDFHLMMLIYACRKWEGTAHGKEGQSLKWVRHADLMALPMPPADIPVAALLQSLL
jgi:8-oxo-dGTP diphosphatase